MSNSTKHGSAALELMDYSVYASGTTAVVRDTSIRYADAKVSLVSHVPILGATFELRLEADVETWAPGRPLAATVVISREGFRDGGVVRSRDDCRAFRSALGKKIQEWASVNAN